MKALPYVGFLIALFLAFLLGRETYRRKVAESPRDTVETVKIITLQPKPISTAHIASLLNDAKQLARIDSLIAEADTLESVIRTLAKQVYFDKRTFSDSTFVPELKSFVKVSGTRDAMYDPMKMLREESSLSVNDIYDPIHITIPKQTITVTVFDRPAGWIYPASILSAGATTYFAAKGKTVPALVAGGVTLINLTIYFEL